eukprot:Clim_evm13s203 gene=Clim_evmTU13s203
MGARKRKNGTTGLNIDDPDAYNAGKDYQTHHRSYEPGIANSFGMIAFYVFIVLLVLTRHVVLPPVPEESTLQPHDFNAHNTQRFLKGLADLGPKTTGSRANEVLAPNYIVSELEKLRSGVLLNKRLDIDVQKPTGVFWLDFLSGFTNAYDRVTNVIVRVSDAGRISHDAIMFNCHFDTSMDAVGASDDGVSCAIAYDLIRAITHSKELVLLHDVIFVFNGAEEAFMEAAHGFITQHKWAKDIKAFVNLEAAGSGGREVVFQTGPGDQVAEIYAKKVPHPHGSVLGQEFFESGVVPGDTDFRVYRDFGDIPGLDLAFTANGYVYHTALDTYERIPLGSIQRAGDNVMALLQGFEEMLHVEDSFKTEPTRPVFFDVIGLYAVQYGHSTKHVLHGFVAVGLVIALYLRNNHDGFTGLRRSLVTHLLSMLGGLLSAVVVGLVMLYVRPMIWYTQKTFVAGLFVSAALLGSQRIFASHRRRMLDMTDREAFDGAAVFFLTILIVMASFGLGSAVWPFVWSAGALFYITMEALLMPGNSNKSIAFVSTKIAWPIEAIAFTIPLIYNTQLLATTGELLVPIMGRSGQSPSDIVIALLSALYLVTSTRFLMRHLTSHTNAIRRLLPVLLTFVLLTTIALSFGASVYTADTPKRVLFQYMNRRWRNQNNTIETERNDLAVLAIDWYGVAPMADLHPAFRDLESCGCGDVYCDMPWYIPIHHMLGDSMCHPLDPINKGIKEIEWRPEVKFTSKPNGPSQRIIEVSIHGPEHFNFYLPEVHEGRTIIDWTVNTQEGLPPKTQEGVYFVYTASGEVERDYDFSFTIESTDGATLSTPYPFAVSSFKFEAPWNSTAYIDEIHTTLPDWVTPATFSSTWDKYWG